VSDIQRQAVELAVADDVGGGLAAEAAGQQGSEGGVCGGRYLFAQAGVELRAIQTQGVSQEDLRLQGRLLDARRCQLSGGAT
jgi:hypothetical protein